MRRCRHRWPYFVVYGGMLLSTSFAPTRSAIADAAPAIVRARLATESSSGSLTKYEYSGLRLDGGAELTIISPRQWRTTAAQLVRTLEETHSQYRALFGEIPQFSVTVRLMDEDAFYLSTGAPSWTNAMYFRGQIIIPIPKSGPLDYDNMIRSIRHEYTHAVIYALSGGNCPGWLDEGLAQWAEGAINPLLTEALSDWLKSNPPIPFTLLQGGFTKLPSEMVPAAYAQSLLGTTLIIKQFGLKTIGKLLAALRDSKTSNAAFDQILRASRGETEKSISSNLAVLVKESLGEDSRRLVKNSFSTDPLH